MSPAVCIEPREESMFLSKSVIEDTIEFIELFIEESAPFTELKVEEKSAEFVRASDISV